MVNARFDTSEGDGSVMRRRASRTTLLSLICVCAVLCVVCACLVAALLLQSCHAQSGRRDPGVGEVASESDMDKAALTIKPAWETSYRLPSDTLPEHYDLFLHPNLGNGTFSGEVTIRIKNINSREFFAVNTKRLNIYETYLTKDNDSVTKVPIKEAFEYKRNEFWIVQGVGVFEPGVYKLHLKFKGSLTGKIVGFYRSVYTNSKNVNRTIATSKFQPTYARQAFPCFDEPSFKSLFTVRLVRPTEEYSALSNMNEESQQLMEDTSLTTVTFRTSVPMVTYLACFIVSDFDRLDPQMVTNPTAATTFPFSVYATPAQKSKTTFALATGVTITSYYIDYFEIDFPLPKLDMIAIPDFVSGAMEHWGLITFREVNLLYDATISSTTNKQRVASVIAHELAHMWFGNLMTLKWWDDLWLNEGFASYMEYKGVSHAYGWDMMDQFLIDDLHPVLKLDAVLSSHPIVQTVRHPDEITELFDTISYNKGAAVIRMLEDFLGEENFQKGIHNFLDAFKFSNAVTEDLWVKLQEVADADVNVSKIMDSWTRQMGYPVISVARQGDNFVLRQKRFLADPNANTTGDISPYGYTWEVPLTYVTNAAPDAVEAGTREWMHMEDTERIIIIPGATWVKFNFHQIGYYRVNYDTEGWKALSDALDQNTQSLTISDRGHLLDDVFSLADADLVEYSTALDMSQYLTKEPSYVPWAVASNKFMDLNSLLQDSLAFPSLRQYIQKLVANVYNTVTWTDGGVSESHVNKRLRITVLDLACSLGHKECLTKVGQLFNDWIASPNDRPHPDIRTLVYYHGMSSVGSEANWDTVWDLFLAETDAQEKSKLLYGLSAIKEPWLIRRFLQYAKNENYIRSQDYYSVLQNIGRNSIGNPIVWDFIRSEWPYLVERFTLNDRNLGRMVSSITSSFASEFKLKEMETFYTMYPDAGAGTTARKQSLESVANRVKWIQRNEQKVREWLEAHK